MTDQTLSRGTCYGYEVRSPLPFRFLRGGGGETPLRVTKGSRRGAPDDGPMAEWVRRPGRRFHGRLYSQDGGYRYWTDRDGWFDIDPVSAAISLPDGGHPVHREMRLWALPAVLCFLARGDLSLHAAAVEVDGAALLLAGPGRFGKTTLAAGFLRAGHRVLSEDISCCRVSGEPAILPGPALLRVRPDVHARLRLPGTVPVAADPDRVSLGLADPIRGDGRPVPLRGIVFLRRRETGCRIERLPLERALPDLWALSWKLPDDGDLTRCFRGITSLAGALPVWNLARPLDLDGLDEVVHTIVAVCLR